MPNPITEISIPYSRYIDLLNAEGVLAALEAGGVDNWEGYESALEELEG